MDDLSINNLPIYKLPREIIDIIISYTYNPQPAELLEDIRHFNCSRELIYSLFIHNYHSSQYKYLLSHDLVYFVNGKNIIDIGYAESFFDFFTRHVLINSIEQVEPYFLQIESIPVESEINIIWGLLTPQERSNFINFKWSPKQIQKHLDYLIDNY